MADLGRMVGGVDQSGQVFFSNDNDEDIWRCLMMVMMVIML